MVVESDTVVDEHTVMIHPDDTLIACFAVPHPCRLHFITFQALLDLVYWPQIPRKRIKIRSHCPQSLYFTLCKGAVGLDVVVSDSLETNLTFLHILQRHRLLVHAKCICNKHSHVQIQSNHAQYLYIDNYAYITTVLYQWLCSVHSWWKENWACRGRWKCTDAHSSCRRTSLLIALLLFSLHILIL